MVARQENSGGYTEVQRWAQPILWIFILMLDALAWGIFLLQIVLKKPVGNNPAPDALVIVLVVLFGGLLPLLLLVTHLKVEVRDGAVRVRHFPFTSRTIPLSDINDCHARTYHPLREYGGWGVRRGFGNGRAYTIAGRRGVQLTLADGRRILIGSSAPEELAAAINAARMT